MLHNLVVFLLLGLSPGTLIAGLALAIIVQHRGSGLINISAGAVAMFAAYVCFGLRTGGFIVLPFPFPPHRIDFGGPWPLWAAFLFTIAACIVFGVLLDAVLLRRLRSAPPLAKLVASVGVLLMLVAIVVLRFGSNGASAPAVLPQGPGDVVTVFGIGIPTNRFMLVAILCAATAGLALLYRYSRFGVATRAAAEDETSAMLAGLSPQRLSMQNTVLSTVLAGSIGVLVAPTAQLDPSTLTFAVIPALGAALLAGFSSFGIAAAAGLAMGILQSELIYLQSQEWFPTVGGTNIPGIAELVFFLVVAGALFWRGARLPTRGALVEQRLPPAPRATPRTGRRLALVLVTVALVVFLPFEWRQALTNDLLGTLVCLSLVVVAGFVGQVSLAQVALAGVAGFALYHVTTGTGIPFPFDATIAILAATGIGVALGLPALRVRGVNLAVVTLAAAVAIEQFGFQNIVWGGNPLSSTVPPPRLPGLDLGPRASFPGWDHKLPSPVFGLVCLAAVVAGSVVVMRLRRSLLGQQMLAVRANERAAAALGINVAKVKLIGFAISSLLAGLAGVLYAYNFGSISAERFGVLSAFAFVAFAYLGGITTVGGAVIGGLFVTGGVFSLLLDRYIGVPIEYQLFAAGVGLIFSVLYFPHGAALVPPHRHPPVVIVRLLVRLVRALLRTLRAESPSTPAGAAGE